LEKKLNISTKNSENLYQIFGINTTLKDYQLCFLINDFFGIETRLLDTGDIRDNFSVFGDIIDEIKVLLIQNILRDNTSVFSKLKSFEYIIVVNENEEQFVDIVKSFEAKDEILYISKVEDKFVLSKEQNIINQLLALL